MEERNIKISLEKAKEWYEQGGDLKEVALQVFSEDELTDKFPSSWDEYFRNKDYRGNNYEYAPSMNGANGFCWFQNKEEAKAFVALGKLIQLRDEYWRLDNNWKPDWQQRSLKFCICTYEDSIVSDSSYGYRHILAFRTDELLDKFYNNFKDLIKQAKMFL